jgi:hypothetical protein
MTRSPKYPAGELPQAARISTDYDLGSITGFAQIGPDSGAFCASRLPLVNWGGMDWRCQGGPAGEALKSVWYVESQR